MSAKQGTTVIDGTGYTGTGGLGKSDASRINAAFATSPVITEGENCTADGKDLKTWYQENVLDGTQSDNTLFEGGVSMDYADAPGATTDTGDGGKPAGPFVPSTGSPGEGNGDDATKVPEVTPVPGHDGTLGSIATPSETSSASGNGLLTSPQTTGTSPSAG
jgi:hypothetical protein